ncbi:MAG: hypothetical protein NTY42_04350 [Planctomycetota bacterium]|nr:hypothetical protein [Planctomycetota bacterium]
MSRPAFTLYNILICDPSTEGFLLINESVSIEEASNWITEYLATNEETPTDPILWPCGQPYPSEWNVVRSVDIEHLNREALPGAFVDSADAKAKLLNLLASLTQYVEHEETTICDASYLGHIARTFEDLAGEIESTNLGGDEDLPLRLFTRGMIWEIEPDPLLLDLVEKHKADAEAQKPVIDFEQLLSELEQLGHDAFVSTVKMHLEEHSRQESSVKVILGESL